MREIEREKERDRDRERDKYSQLNVGRHNSHRWRGGCVRVLECAIFVFA